MTDHRIVYTNNDGGLSVVIPAPQAREQVMVSPEIVDDEGVVVKEAVYRDEHDEEFFARIIDKDVPKDIEGKTIEHKIIHKDALPTDRYFRNAWHHKSGNVAVDMEKARDIHMGVIRQHRDKKLQELDLETMKGKDVQKEKQVLRDLPQKFSLKSAKTPEDLKAKWPTELVNNVAA